MMAMTTMAAAVISMIVMPAVMVFVLSMTMMVTLNPEVADFNTTQEALTATGERIGVQITIQREDVFDAMFTI